MMTTEKQVKIAAQLYDMRDKARRLLVFKWAETQVKVAEVLALAPHPPLFGNTSGKKAGTHWIVFMKPAAGVPEGGKS